MSGVPPEEEEEEQLVKVLTPKELKKLARPEFNANPEKYYPTKIFAKLGFSRAACPECKNSYWRRTAKRDTCGDSQCAKKYSFIGVGTGAGRGKDGKKITYADAWKSFEKSLTSARVPCTSIKRYPVVARWRADVDYVAAGIYCFQPYCVTGELEPPANPLICPQFCLRFNDLDNIGLTGRHYSGFIMMGIQVFNKPNDRKFWNEECVEFNYNWLTEGLGIDPDEITFIEDVWAGGGNLGPSIEYFVGGLEVGNMVFMQYKTFPDGRREPLEVQVIDVGIGLERIPWLVNGTPTSYVDTFKSALEFMLTKIKLEIREDIWEKYGPMSCLLNVDEVDDLEKTWEEISKEIGLPTKEVKQAIESMKDLYLILDHSRSVMMAVVDGSLPSNVGGGSNVRNILRRTFAIMQKNEWWKHFSFAEFLHIFELHKSDLAKIYGDFPPYKSFDEIITREYDRWKNTDDAQTQKLKKLLVKTKGKLSLDDWITCVTAYGLPADTVAAVAKCDIPLNLWYEIDNRQQQFMKQAAPILYSTSHLPETVNTYYMNHKEYTFKGSKILEVMPNVTQQGAPSIVILDKSPFYPTSGGQEHDTGKLVIEGKTYDVVDAIKVGPTVLHIISPPLDANAELKSWIGKEVSGEVDFARRNQLRNHHTATHIIFASCRRVLGPHVWQNGAKKKVTEAHLDITHFASLSPEEVAKIETEANRIISSCKPISKGFMPKDKAEGEYGMTLYQGGVVPGNSLRIVSIEDTDTEACCGTHCDNTAEVGMVKILRTNRISDGILRLTYVAGEKALEFMNHQSDVLNQLKSSWGVGLDDLVTTADRFFDGYKKYGNVVSKQTKEILGLNLKCLLLDNAINTVVLRSDESNPTLFISSIPDWAAQLKDAKKSVIAVGETWFYALFTTDEGAAKVKEIEDKCKEIEKAKASTASDEDKAKMKPVQFKSKNVLQCPSGDKSKKAAKVKVDGVCEVVSFALYDPTAVAAFVQEVTGASVL